MHDAPGLRALRRQQESIGKLPLCRPRLEGTGSAFRFLEGLHSFERLVPTSWLASEARDLVALDAPPHLGFFSEMSARYT